MAAVEGSRKFSSRGYFWEESIVGADPIRRNDYLIFSAMLTGALGCDEMSVLAAFPESLALVTEPD